MLFAYSVPRAILRRRTSDYLIYNYGVFPIFIANSLRYALDMKPILLFLTFVTLVTSAFADKAITGHTKKNGTVVRSHRRTEANRTETDNYVTKGNTNPHTKKPGTKRPKR